MNNGFRVPPKPTKKQAALKIDTELANIQMSNRVSQMMIQQLMKNVKGMSEDLNSAIQQIYELKYQLNALQTHLKVDPRTITDVANLQRLVDFDEASTKADAKENLEIAAEIGEDSTIVIRSDATDESGTDRGIFRSRLKLSESGVPDMIKELQGKKVGDKVVAKLNGLDHTVEVLAIRNPIPKLAAVETAQ